MGRFIVITFGEGEARLWFLKQLNYLQLAYWLGFKNLYCTPLPMLSICLVCVWSLSI